MVQNSTQGQASAWSNRFTHHRQRPTAGKTSMVPADRMEQGIRYVLSIFFFSRNTYFGTLGDAGPVYGLNLAGQPVLVLNSHKVASEVLDKRSAIYSDRPRMIVVSEILCQGLFFAFVRYGDWCASHSFHPSFFDHLHFVSCCRWRRLRKLTNEGTTAKACEAYYPFQAREAILLTQGLFEDGDHWERHVNRYVELFPHFVNANDH